MAEMNSVSPVFAYGSILHVQISPDEACRIQRGPGAPRLAVSHGAFHNDGTDAYHSPALDAILESGEPWLFLDWWTGSWATNAFRFQLQSLVRQHPQTGIVLFEEALAGGGMLSLTADRAGFSFDCCGNLPSCMLIRRDVFCALVKQVHSLFPYPIRKLANAARIEGVQTEVVHETVPGKFPVEEYLMVPAGRQKILCGKKEHKKLLVITHELSWTGAPLVLAEACIDVLAPAGYEIMVLSPKEGPVSRKYAAGGIPVMVVPEIASPDSSALYAMIQPYDAVIVNTIVPYACIEALNVMEKPVLWWIHESDPIYPCVEAYLPKELNPHMHVCCVGQYALGVLKKYRAAYDAGVLIYGLADRNPEKHFRDHTPDRPIVFASVGSVVALKGQDILTKAIALLAEEVRAKCEFLFIGKAEDPEILEAVETAAKTYPEHVRYLGPVARDVLDEIYPEADGIICSSRHDCMPTFVAEGMMFGKPAICSENTGMAPILQAEQAGLVYTNDDPQKLAEAITEFVGMSCEEWRSYGRRARLCFENHFSLPVFRKNLLGIMDALAAPASTED